MPFWNIILRFVILASVQVLFFNNLYLWQYLNPLLYLYFIIKLPFNTPKWMLLLWGFAMGLTIDFFSGTPGMNAAATLLAAFIRPFTLQVATGRRDPDTDILPSVREMRSAWYVFVGILVFVHHLALFMLEDFGNGQWGTIITRTLITGTATVSMISLTEYLFVKVKN